MQTILGRQWCGMAADEVSRLLETDADTGLDRFAIERRLERFGPNALTQRRGESAVLRFLRQFHNALVYLLLAAGLVTGVLGEWVDCGVILGVVLINAIIGFLQEAKALRAIEALNLAMSSEAMVVRAGQRDRIASQGLVPGDIVLLQAGDKVPADLRLIRTRELQLAEAALTGESVPVHKSSAPVDPGAVLAERYNMAYMSTMVTAGTGTGVVVATGDGTEIGRVSELIASAEVLSTPLTRKIARFSNLLLYVIVGLAALAFIVGVLRGQSWVSMFVAAVALAVGAIPEGLPAAMTITLAIGVARMARRQAIIRKLPAVETLGSTTVICSDKTGTLTQNEMTVQQAMAGAERYRVSGTGYGPDGAFLIDDATVEPRQNRALLECLKAAVLCNDSALSQTADGWRVSGDPTEGALIAASRKAALQHDTLQREQPRLDTIPFESEHRCMATLHASSPGEPRVAYLKGSVDKLLGRCVAAMGPDGTALPLDAAAIQTTQEAMAVAGLRVLAFARAELPEEQRALRREDLAGDLTFLGLQGMMDPPRPEAAAAVDVCQRAGVRVKMITGDHAGTALAIARQIGIVADTGTPQQPATASLVRTGAELATLTDTELVDAAQSTPVFARVTPEQKLRLVQALQARGHVVAMTGDGVNDAPALRRADIGVAMGITGTEVAKEAADMVLADDNFATIGAAVEEGRSVFDNLIKFIAWTLPTNLGEGLVILAAVLLGIALPILPVQILWINMTTAVALGLTLAFEPKEPGIMNRRPRDPKTPILTGALVFRIGLVGLLLLAGSFGLFEWQLHRGAGEAQARTVAVNVFVFGQLFYLFNCRSLEHSVLSIGLLSNRPLLVGIAVTIALQLLLTYAPPMQRLFQTAPIGPEAWAAIVGFGVIVLVAVGAEKSIRKRRSASTDRDQQPAQS